MVLSSERYTFVTDETTGIYRALTPSILPEANTLATPISFPGAIPNDTPPTKDEEPTTQERIRQFLTPQVCLSCCSVTCCYTSCSCDTCLSNCCSGCTFTQPPPGRCWFSTGCTVYCTYVEGTCGNKECNCCAMKILGGCCQVNPQQCEAGCPPCP